MQVRKEIQVFGTVQGVGFRPYIYRLATDRSLEGNISNTPAGVTIEVQGPNEAVDDFVARLPEEAPELAHITRLQVRELPCRRDNGFEIRLSRTGGHASAQISPDVAVCADCLREMFDPDDRRYLYPFINCTNCGPRFTILREIPYDRPRTSMAVFPMCAECRAEYDDPRNRRFHAQPNACWKCGPQLELWDESGGAIQANDPILAVIERLHTGEIAAIKGLGGFHLAVDATNSAAVDELRRRKRRAEKPFAVMVADASAASCFCEMSVEEQRLLESRQRPIVLLRKSAGGALSESIAPGHGEIGIFLPYTPLHYLLFAGGKFTALVMTSANLSDEPIAIDNREAVSRLSGIADSFLVHNRDILIRCDDSVVRFAGGRARQIRRSRGYVPSPVMLRREVPEILAVGGELKNTICLTRGAEAFLSQHVGDLENVTAFDFFRETVEHLSKVLEIEPRIIAHDLHPDYLSTKWALERTGVKRIAVQHHHAHIASCMAENHLDGEVIGFSFDGTGFGSDGHIWGGEALICGYAGFRRAAHLAYVPMPGGEAAIREPWRMAVSYLAQVFGDSFLRLDVPFVRGLDRRKAETLLQMMQKRINSPLTSSCGRLFDAVAALLGLRSTVTYEAQAAVELESLARRSNDEQAHPFEIVSRGNTWQIDARPLFDAIVCDLGRGLPSGAIARRFHNGLSKTLAQLAEILRQETSFNCVCLSGGAFYNQILTSRLLQELKAADFEVFTHSEVPAGDGGLSLGQAIVAAHTVSSQGKP